MAACNSSVGDQKTSVEFCETGLRCPVLRFHNGGNQLQSPAPPSPSPWMDHDQLLLACAHGRDIVQVICSVGVSSVQCFQATGKPSPMAGVDNIRHSLHFSTQSRPVVQCYSFPVSTVLNRASIRSAVLAGYTNVTADHATPSSLTIGCI